MDYRCESYVKSLSRSQLLSISRACILPKNEKYENRRMFDAEIGKSCYGSGLPDRLFD